MRPTRDSRPCSVEADGRLALNELPLTVSPGERLGIIGPSGAGKSTFLLHRNGVLLPTSGVAQIDGYQQRSTHDLSFSEKRRVALATVLAMRPRVIAFDEPFANLDPGTVE